LRGEGVEAGIAMGELVNDLGLKKKVGAIGVLSKGLLTKEGTQRDSGFDGDDTRSQSGAVECALPDRPPVTSRGGVRGEGVEGRSSKF
jgi:hypothetical protein